MSQVNGRVTFRTQTSRTQGRIHTENPQLLRLLQKSSSENKNATPSEAVNSFGRNNKVESKNALGRNGHKAESKNSFGKNSSKGGSQNSFGKNNRRVASQNSSGKNNSKVDLKNGVRKNRKGESNNSFRKNDSEVKNSVGGVKDGGENIACFRQWSQRSTTKQREDFHGKHNLIAKWKKANTDLRRFKKEDFLVSGARGGPLVFLLSVSNKENSRPPYKDPGHTRPAVDSMHESRTGIVSRPKSGHRAANVHRDTAATDDDRTGEQNTVLSGKRKNSVTFTDERVIIETVDEDKNRYIVSDVEESDCETVDSTSSELACLQSRDSVSETSIPSSPLCLQQLESGKHNNSAGKGRAARATPHPSALKPGSRTPTPGSGREKAPDTPSRVSYQFKTGNTDSAPFESKTIFVTAVRPSFAPPGGQTASNPGPPTLNTIGGHPPPDPLRTEARPTESSLTSSGPPQAADVSQSSARETARLTKTYLPPAQSGKTPLLSHKPVPVYSKASPRQFKAPLIHTSLINVPRTERRALITADASHLTSPTSKNLVLIDSFQPPVTAYSSQRLKLQGDAAKRSSSVLTLRDSLEDNSEIPQDSLDFEEGLSDWSQEKDRGATLDEVFETVEENSGPEEVTAEDKNLNNIYSENRDTDTQSNNSSGDDRSKAVHREKIAADVQPQEHSIVIADVTATSNLVLNTSSDQPGTNDSFKPDNDRALADSDRDRKLPPPAAQEEEGKDVVEFVVKSNPNKRGPSKYSSAQACAGFSETPQQSLSTSPATAAPSRRNSTRTTPSAKKVYVESPTFTKEEEEEYRYVSSRLDNVEEEQPDTYRELDMAAIQVQERHAAAQKAGLEKRVRYSDVEGRYEDRNGDSRLYGVREGERRGEPDQPERFAAWEVTSFGNSDSRGEHLGDSWDRGARAGQYREDSRNLRDMDQQQQQQRRTHVFAHPPSHELQHAHPHQIQQHMNGAGVGMPGFSIQQGHNVQHTNGSGSSLQMGYGNNRQPPSYPAQQGAIANQQPQQPPAGYLNPFQQQQPVPNAHISSFKHHILLQQQQPPLQQTSQPPVKSLPLPTGPSYDPVDEQDLQRETNYQEGLLMRVQDGNRKAQEVAIPTLPLNPPQGQGQQQHAALRDSLDYDTGDDTRREFDAGFVQDSLDIYPHPQQPTDYLPSSSPQNLAGVNSNNHFSGGHLNHVNFDSEDYSDYPDVRQPRTNPQVQPRFHNPQLNLAHGGRKSPQELYDSEGTAEHSDNAYPLPQRYEDRQGEGDEQEQEGEAAKEEPPMEAVHPKPPKYDFVNHNKEDYGKQHPKSYIKIHETMQEEMGRIHEIFIHPKPKSKGRGILKAKGQSQQQQPPGQQGPEIDPNLSLAEKMWAQRSASLAKRFENNNASSRGGRRAAPGGLQKYNHDSSLTLVGSSQKQRPNCQTTSPQPQNHPPPAKPQPPEKRAFITEMGTPQSEGSLQNQISQPMFHRPPAAEMFIPPVSQHVVTDDGQRISVDVNLKLISPTSHPTGRGAYQYYYPQPTQPPHQHPPRQPYGGGGGGGGRVRQYPAVTQYDDQGTSGEYRMPALEYNQRDYDHNHNDYRYVSPRDRYSADEALLTLSDSRTELNPYGKIPPILTHQDDNHPSSAPAPDQGGSYVNMYLKQKEKDEKPWYKVYGLKDYRKMQKEVRLGTLGPDMDSDVVKERREKVNRQNDYAKIVMEKNRMDLTNRKPPAFPRPKEENDIISKRKLAEEYAKSVPKPTVKVVPNEYNNYELASEKSPIAKHHKKGDHSVMSGSQTNVSSSPTKKKEKEMDILDLETLRQRYEEDKQNEAIIRRNTVSSKGTSYY